MVCYVRRTFKYFLPYSNSFSVKKIQEFLLWAKHKHLFLKASHSEYYPNSQIILPCTPNPEKCVVKPKNLIKHIHLNIRKQTEMSYINHPNRTSQE